MNNSLGRRLTVSPPSRGWTGGIPNYFGSRLWLDSRDSRGTGEAGGWGGAEESLRKRVETAVWWSGEGTGCEEHPRRLGTPPGGGRAPALAQPISAAGLVERQCARAGRMFTQNSHSELPARPPPSSRSGLARMGTEPR